jgi:hypothetical protein
MSSSSSKAHDINIEMEPVGSSLEFQDFDVESVYRVATDRADSTRNIVVEFGREEAQIAFDIATEGVRTLLGDSNRPALRPVRWM